MIACQTSLSLEPSLCNDGLKQIELVVQADADD
jgi:hypothetical protein